MDDIGADLIAAGRDQRFAVSVKTRLFRPGSSESLVYIVESKHIQKLQLFAKRFGMVPLLAQVVVLADEKIVHLFIFRIWQLESLLPVVKNGYSIRFGPKHIESLVRHPWVDYTCWREELSAGSWFGEPMDAATDLANEAMQADEPPLDAQPSDESDDLEF